MLGSFKLKLAVYFLLLAVLPLTAAFWGFGTVTKRTEERRVDGRLGAELRAVVRSYERRFAAVERAARRIAARPSIQEALASGRFGRLPPGVRVVGAHRLTVGTRANLAAARGVRVRAGSKVLGSVVATLPLDRSLLRTLRADSGLTSGDRLVFVPSKRQQVPAKRPFAVSLASDHYRAVATGPLPEQPRIQIAVLSPTEAIADEAGETSKRLLFVLLGGLLVLAAIAAAEGRSIMRSVGELASAAEAIGAGQLERRVPVRGRDEFAALARSFNSMAAQLRARLKELELQRRRLSDSLSRFGELLAATHDVDQLLPMIAAAAVEAANADGAVLISEDGAVVEVGDLPGDAEQVELPIASGGSRFGIIVLHGAGFKEDDLVAARSLVTQAAVALENARLHEAAELLAISDGLTGLYNRRHCEERLVAEVARSERYETPLALILCDIDGFKAANDAHGHGFGDRVLEQVAAVLRAALRDTDVSGRWGGEEFLIVLPETDLAGALDAAERIRTAFEATEFETDAGKSVRVTASFGVARFHPGISSRELVQAADEALYTAKREGKNQVVAAAERASATR